MSLTRTTVAAALALAVAFATMGAQQPPPFATTKVEGTDNVYVFRQGGAQAMFIVTSAGVIATDPVSYGRPEGAANYVAEIKKVTTQPIRYVIYSHHHYDHVAGGRPFKDAGATFIAHRRARERLAALGEPHTVIPDETVDANRTITLGNTTLELQYLGLNHSDSTLVMRLPKERLVFAVDFVSVGTLPGRGMIDSYPLEWEESLKKLLAMDWDRLIPGHPAPGGRLGTKKDVQSLLEFLQYASAKVRAAAREGQQAGRIGFLEIRMVDQLAGHDRHAAHAADAFALNQVEKEMQLPKYKDWPNYEAALPFVLRRYCGLWGRGT